MPTEHFKSANAYRKWNAYRHIHGIPAPHLKTAIVAGKPHKVHHSPLSESRERRNSDIAKYRGTATDYKSSRPKRKIYKRTA